MKIARVGVDIAKNVFHLYAVDSRDHKVWSAELKRSQWLLSLSAKSEAGVEVGMEASASAHHWARELSARGFNVKLIAARHMNQFNVSKTHVAR